MNNPYEDIDFTALEMAEDIISRQIPSTPETYRLVKKWYEGNSASVEIVKQDLDDLPF